MRITLLAVISILASVLGACGRGQPEAAAGDGGGTPRRGGTAVVAIGADLPSYNPYVSVTTSTVVELSTLLFLHLVEEQADYTDHPPTFRPCLAESWEASPDGKALTFHLNQKALWSDGVPVTAEDVRFTWQAQTSPEVAWDSAHYKDDITEVEVVDPHTVRFHFVKPSPLRMLQVNEGPIVPKHVWGTRPFAQWRDDDGWFGQHMVGSGPFLLQRRVPQQELVLVRNERYLEPGKPYLDRLVVRIIPDVSNMVATFLGGGTDAVFGLSTSDVERVEASGRGRVVSWWGRGQNFVAWNQRRPIFRSANVRRALTLAIDRHGITETLYGAYGRVAATPVVSDVWACDRSLKPLPYDPEEARRLLAAEGFRDADGDGILERGGKKLSFDLATNAGNPQRASSLVMIQEQLRRVGVDARPRFVAFNPLMEQADRGDFDAILMRWSMPTDMDLSFAFATESIGKGSNVFGYSRPDLDRLLAETREATTIEDFARGLAEVQRILHQDQPATYLYEAKDLAALSTRLQGAAPSSLRRLWHAWEWWLAEP